MWDKCSSFLILTTTDIFTNGVNFRWIRSYVKCLFDAIQNCPFLSEQYQNLIAPTEKVNTVISLCRITVDLNTGEFFIGNKSQLLSQISTGEVLFGFKFKNM